MNNLTFTILYLTATLSCFVLIGLTAYLMINYSGWWVLLLFTSSFIKYPTRIDNIEKMSDKQITEAVAREVERSPSTYRNKVH